MFGQSNSDSLPAYIKPNNQNITVTPAVTQQVFTADQDHTGLGTVTVNAVTSSIDNNITAGNIKKDVTILGVTGNYEGSGGDTITAINKTGSAITAGDKVWINKAGADYELVNFYQGPYFFIGSKGDALSFDNTTGEISGFSSGSTGCFIPQAIMPINTANSWKIVRKAKTPATISRNQTLINGSSNNYYNASITMEIDTSNQAGPFMACAIRTESGNVWNIWLVPNVSKPEVILTTNTWYWWSVEFTGTEYIFKQSTDGVNYIELARVTSSTKAYQPTGYIITGYVGKYWKGKVDLSESYIEVDGSLWWKGALKDTQAENCLSGIAQESIANNASGNVKTVLPSE